LLETGVLNGICLKSLKKFGLQKKVVFKTSSTAIIRNINKIDSIESVNNFYIKDKKRGFIRFDTSKLIH